MNRQGLSGWRLAYSGKVGSGLAVGLLLGALAARIAWAADPYSALRKAIVSLPAPLTRDGFFAVRIWPVIPAFAAVLVAMLLLMGLHYLRYGPKDLRGEAAEPRLPWWPLIDRIVHGLVAASFLLLMFTGLAVTFGRWLPTFGLGYGLRVTHELVAFAFTPVFAVMALRMLPHAFFRRFDLAWLAHAGGYLGYQGPLRAGKLNAGQKLWYWVMTLAGLVLVGTGFALYFAWGSPGLLRLWAFAHFVAMAPMIAFFLVHLYLSTLANRGVWRAMWQGVVPRSAATAYHPDAQEVRGDLPRAA